MVSRIGNWGTGPFRRPAAPSPAAQPAAPAAPFRRPGVSMTGDLGPATPAGRSPEEQETRQEIADRARALRAEHDRLEESLGRAAPHEWPGIYEQLRELTRDIVSQDRMLRIADDLSAAGGDASDWHKLGAWATRAQRANTENQLQLQFQAEQLVRDAAGLPKGPRQSVAYEALAGEMGRVAEQIATLQDQLDKYPPQAEADQLRQALALAEQNMDNLNEAKSVLDEVANNPGDRALGVWPQVAGMVQGMAEQDPAAREQTVADIQALMRSDFRGDRVQNAFEQQVYQRLSEVQTQLNGRINDLHAQIAAGQGSPQARQALHALERQRERLVSLEQQISRFESGGNSDRLAWNRIETMLPALAAAVGTPRFEQLARGIHQVTLNPPRTPQWPQPIQRPRPTPPFQRPQPIQPFQRPDAPEPPRPFQRPQAVTPPQPVVRPRPAQDNEPPGPTPL